MTDILTRRSVLAGAAAVTLAVLSGRAIAATPQQAQDMVARAIALFDEKGEAAFAAFNEGKASGFVEGEVYIVVQSVGPDAKVLAHATNSKLIGTPLTQIVDENGKAFGLEMSQKATADGAWFDYIWPNPATGKVQRKETWAVLHENLVFVAGIYAE
jgi:cytochrome c